MTALQKKIIERILLEGPMSFETFMEMALFTPHLGLITRENLRLSEGKRISTRVLIFKIFGAMIAKQIEEMWDLLDRPARFIIAEIGAGMGYVAMFFWTHRFAPGVDPASFIGSAPYLSLRVVDQVVAFAIAGYLLVSGYFISFAGGRKQETVTWKVIFSRIGYLLVPYLLWWTSTRST